MKTLLLATAGSFLLASAAIAQTTGGTASAPANPPAATNNTQHGVNLQQQVRANLQQSGFSDVKVVPDSFLVEAKDKSGNPITMMINPNSVTELVAMESGQPNSGKMGSDRFVSLPTSDRLQSQVVGLDVHNDAKQDIGTIKDVAYDGVRVNGYILSVGGFLGVGDHYVAVSPSALHIAYDTGAKAWHATMDATAAQLKAAPQYHYPSQS